MLQSWRWFGPEDPVTLASIRQAGADHIVSALHDLPPGDVWPAQAIRARRQQVEDAGDDQYPLQWSVVESIPIHRSIQTGASDRDRFIESFRDSLRNVGACGISTVCYNFMPILDWSRTDLAFQLSNGAQALRFSVSSMATFDIHILRRGGAENDYEQETVEEASKLYQAMTESSRDALTRTILAGLPGSDRSYDLDEFRAVLDEFRDVGHDALRENLIYFQTHVLPVAEESGVRIAIHPDDPPFPILGLPRVVSTESDLDALFGANASVANGLTLCTGSFGARSDNDVPHLFRKHASRTHFLHLRNVRREGDRSFHESEHLCGDVDMVDVVRGVVDEEDRRRAEGREDWQIPMRPDHGHLLLDDLTIAANPGYSAIGRLRGLAELRGLEMGIRQSRK